MPSVNAYARQAPVPRAPAHHDYAPQPTPPGPLVQGWWVPRHRQLPGRTSFGGGGFGSGGGRVPTSPSTIHDVVAMVQAGKKRPAPKGPGPLQRELASRGERLRQAREELLEEEAARQPARPPTPLPPGHPAAAPDYEGGLFLDRRPEGRRSSPTFTPPAQGMTDGDGHNGGNGGAAGAGVTVPSSPGGGPTPSWGTPGDLITAASSLW
jgi:hypothetical protein